MSTSVSVLVVGSPRPRGCATRPELAEMLGAERCQRLEGLLFDRALEWARHAAAPGRLFVLGDGGEAGEGVRVPALEAAGCSAQLAAAVTTVREDGPLLIVWPALARWRHLHLEGALSDVASGCDVSVGPVFEGGFYLIALRERPAEMFAVPDEAWSSPEAMGLVLGAAHQAQLSAGLLRPERGLRTLGDARAALADPLLDPAVRAVLTVELHKRPLGHSRARGSGQLSPPSQVLVSSSCRRSWAASSIALWRHSLAR